MGASPKSWSQRRVHHPKKGQAGRGAWYGEFSCHFRVDLWATGELWRARGFQRPGQGDLERVTCLGLVQHSEVAEQDLDPLSVMPEATVASPVLLSCVIRAIHGPRTSQSIH